ncbi:MAG: (2Fe-2S) ferredoxin domain-containing protein [Magnetococcales bacterium]|nr:(2Fe-2S) ferredoxin domain-containing protein [Magnetococcales bacterium]
MNTSLIACIKDRATAKPSCGGRGSEALVDQIEAEVNRQKLPIAVVRMRCLGECSKGPNMRIAPGGQFFYGVKEETIPEIITALKEALNSP